MTMALIRNGKVVEDEFTDVSSREEVPADGAVIVSLGQWQSGRDALAGRRLGIRLRSDESPDLITDDLDHFSVVALEFPVFRDGRAYSYARILREACGFSGELRAVGEVLLEQLHFMIRVGFDAFELASDDPERDYQTAAEEFTAWYQPTADGRLSAVQLRFRS